jgi:hypothetical protein
MKFKDYKWIKVKAYKMNQKASWKVRYRQLEKHHIEETSFLIRLIRKLANAPKVLH